MPDYDSMLDSIEHRGRTAPPTKGPANYDAMLDSIQHRGRTAGEGDDTSGLGSGTFSLPDWSTPGHLGKGAVKGLVGQGVGIGQLAADIDPTGISQRIGETETAQGIKKWAMAPSESTAESIGYGAGAVAPYLFGGEALGAGRLANTALGVYRGAASAAIQPTAEGTLASHGKAAIPGAVLGAIPGAGAGSIHLLAWGLRGLGIPVHHIPTIIKTLWRHGRNAANSQAAQRMQQNIYQAGGGTMLDEVARRVRPAASTAFGIGAGQTFGRGVEPDA